MGIGITGISKAELVRCSGEYIEGEYDVCLEEHFTVDAPFRRRNGVKSGCYIVGQGGRTFDLDFGYAAYSGWVRRLSLMALGVEPEEVWNHPRRFRGKPFVELIGFPDTGGGAIGPSISAKLYGDFVVFAAKASRYFAASTPNVFSPPPTSKPSVKRKPHRNRMGLSSVDELNQALDGSATDWDEGENLDWMSESYRDFRRALRLAKDAGILVFY
jgi:hypothetical protein